MKRSEAPARSYEPSELDIAKRRAEAAEALLQQRTEDNRTLEMMLPPLHNKIAALKADLKARTAERDELKRLNHKWLIDYGMLAKAKSAAEAERDALRALLVRLRGWDHLIVAGDGPYWKHEIDLLTERATSSDQSVESSDAIKAGDARRTPDASAEPGAGSHPPDRSVRSDARARPPLDAPTGGRR